MLSKSIACSSWGKCRNAPVQEWSVPRLELQAAVISSRLHKLIDKELELSITRTFFWSDSMTTLQYIKNKKRRFRPFVANRLSEIHDVSSPNEWRHVPGDLNPAYDGSRGMKILAFQPSCRWWTGPSFLWQPEECWPIQHVGDVPDTDIEQISEKYVMVIAPSALVDEFLCQCSSWSRLQRQLAWLLRFIQYLNNPTTPSTMPKMISFAEMRVSSLKIVHLLQCKYFPDELDLLRDGKQVAAHSKLATLNPILIDGIIRVGGRIRHAPLPLDAVHPMILPKEHHVSTLIIRHNHQILGHAGREHVLSFVRRRYWILQGRALTRKILRNCVDCRKRNEAVMQQLMADLPRERLVPYEPPFTYTGIDFFGPFLVKRGRSTEKVYGCIFVCFNCRAVHIEDASSLETDVFIQALRRFISNRGCPKMIWSDNGTNFIGAEKELCLSIENWKKEVIQSEMRSKEIIWEICPISKWRFQPPAASHMSGVWERLIRSVRKSMKAVIGHPHAFLNKETLRTVFAEVVTILNSRPLCPSSEDPKDLEPLTPNRLLLQRRSLAIPPSIFRQDDLHSRKQWRRAQFLANCFWYRWTQEYLPMLQERQKWVRKRRNLKVNDLVLVVDKNTPRGRWLLGRCIKVFPGRDGRVRTAEVKTKESTLVRPVAKLCLLESEQV